MKLPNDSEVDVVQPLSNEPKVDDVPGNMDDLSSNEAEKTLCWEVSDSFFILEEPPRNDSPIEEEEVEMMLEEDSTSAAIIPT